MLTNSPAGKRFWMPAGTFDSCGTMTPFEYLYVLRSEESVCGVNVFGRDYMPHASAGGLLKSINPNMYGMLDSIVCSRATVFAGTYFSTFTGYIHRLRGY